jgi:hypothetical protein
MRKSVILSAVAVVAVFAFLCAPAANAAMMTWYAKTNNTDINILTNWGSNVDGTGTNPSSLPVSGDTDTWVIRGNTRIKAAPAAGTFYGGTLKIIDLPTDDGELLLNKTDFTVQDVILDGGFVNIITTTTTEWKLSGKTITLNSGGFGQEINNATRTVQYDFDTYKGSGDIYLVARYNGATTTSKLGNILFTGGGDFSGFDGMFFIGDSTTAGFDYNITTDTFGITVQDLGGASFHARYNLLNTVTVKSLTLGTESIPADTYTFGDFTTAQQAYLKDNGGTIIVTPEPATMGLLAMGGLFVLRRRRVRRA